MNKINMESSGRLVILLKHLLHGSHYKQIGVLYQQWSGVQDISVCHKAKFPVLDHYFGHLICATFGQPLYCCITV